MHVVIIGGGVVGASAAFYLAKKGARVTIVERCEIACAASGKAGGFLSESMQDGQPTGPLARKSYALHAQLAEEFKAKGVDYGYRRVTTLSLSAREAPRAQRSAKAPSGADALPAWVSTAALSGRVSELGDPSNTAQVHPRLFTRALVEASGARVLIGAAEGVQMAEGPGGARVAAVRVAGHGSVDADAVVIAMGPWTAAASAWLPVAPMSGQRAHSIVLRPERPLTAHCLFLEYQPAQGKVMDPEVYPRPDGTCYICGASDFEPVPEDPAAVRPAPGAADRLRRVAATIAPEALASAPTEVEQACYLPLSPDGLPAIGRLDGVQNAYVASGHSCWGILNAPATGLALAELIVEGRAASVDIAPFDPARFP